MRAPGSVCARHLAGLGAGSHSLSLKEMEKMESVSTNLGQRGKRCDREIKREEGIREGCLEENTLELRFEGGGGRYQPDKEGLACMLGSGLRKHILIWL